MSKVINDTFQRHFGDANKSQENAPSPMSVTESGISIDCKAVQSIKAPSPIIWVPFSIQYLDKFGVCGPFSKISLSALYSAP